MKARKLIPLIGSLALVVLAILALTPDTLMADWGIQQGGIPVDVEHTENSLVEIARGFFGVLQIVAIFAAIGFAFWQAMQAARQRNAADGAKALVLFLMAGFAFSPSTWIRAMGLPDLADEIARVIPARAESSSNTVPRVVTEGPRFRQVEGPYILTLRSSDNQTTVECVGAIEPAESLIYYCREHIKLVERQQRALPDTLWLQITDQGVARVNRRSPPQ